MKYRKLIVTYVVVLLLLGIPLLINPNLFIAVFGASLEPAGKSMSRLYGVSMLGVAWMMWKAKKSEPSVILEGLMQGNLIIWMLSFVIVILGQIQSIFNLMGWTIAGLSVFFSGWYLYIRYFKRENP